MPPPKDPEKYKEYIENMSIAKRGKKFSDIHRKNISKSLSGGKHYLYGKHHPVEWRTNHSKIMIEKGGGKNHPNYGTHLSDDHRKNISKSLTGEKTGSMANTILIKPV